MAVPKKRTSRSRTKMRRSINDRLTLTQVSHCPDCGEPKLPHHACLSCGVYKGAQAIVVKEYTDNP